MANVFPQPEDVPRKRTGRRFLIVLAVLLALLTAGAVAADWVFRTVLQQGIAVAVRSQLPSQLQGKVEVTITGFSATLQYLAGHFDEVRIDAPGLSVSGNPMAAHVVAQGVPTNISSPISDLSGTVTVAAATLNQVVQIPGSTSPLTLGDGTVNYTTSTRLLGVPLGITVTARPEAAGPQVLITPVDVQVNAGSITADLTDVLSRLRGSGPVPVCVASYLPKGLDVTGITITPSDATVVFHASSFSPASAGTRGSC